MSQLDYGMHWDSIDWTPSNCCCLVLYVFHNFNYSCFFFIFFFFLFCLVDRFVCSCFFFSVRKHAETLWSQCIIAVCASQCSVGVCWMLVRIRVPIKLIDGLFPIQQMSSEILFCHYRTIATHRVIVVVVAVVIAVAANADASVHCKSLCYWFSELFFHYLLSLEEVLRFPRKIPNIRHESAGAIDQQWTFQWF